MIRQNGNVQYGYLQENNEKWFIQIRPSNNLLLMQ